MTAAVSTLRRSDLPTLDPGAWLPISEAAGLLNEPLRTAQWRARSHWSKRGLARIAPAPDGKSKHMWWVHRSVDVRLSRCPNGATRDERKRVSLLADYPQHHVERAYRKVLWMQEWRKRCRKPRMAGLTDRQIAETVAVEARGVEGNGFRISARSLQIWHTAYSRCDADGSTRGVAALVDRYGSRENLKPNDSQAAAGRSAEAIEFFKALYETENKISLALAHELTVEEAGRNKGWSWPESYTATLAWWRRTNDESRTCLTRQGKGEWSHTFMPHMERDWTRVAVGSVFIADHRKCDFWVTYKEGQIRPWITAIADGRSRYIVGWRLSASPNQDTILAALLMAFRDCAVPEHLYIDNGKDFRCNRIVNLSRTELRNLKREHGDRWRDVVRRDRDRLSCDDPRWLGIVPELNVNITYALPYSPWSKPIERWFRTMKERCDKLVVTYCGDSPRTRPECLGDIRAGRISKREKGRSAKNGLALIDTAIVPTFDEAVEHVGAFIDRYHRRAHRGRGMGGCSPLAVWNTATSLRQADADALACLVAIRGSYKVQSNGVTVQMDGGRFSYGSNSANLRRYVGKEVLVAVDPSHPALCWAIDKETRRRIDRLEPNEYMHPMATHEDLRDQVAQGQRDKAIGIKARRASARRTHTATQLANQAARRRDRRLAELGATGTDQQCGTGLQPVNITPVSTGFEGVSVPVQSPFEPHSACLPDEGSVADLFAPLEPSEPDDAADDITDLLRDDVEEEADNDFAELL